MAVYITSVDHAEKCIQKLTSSPRLCLDTETTGLQARVCDLRLVQLCSAALSDERITYVFDMFKLKDKINYELKELIETREMLVLHNANFDLQFLLAQGIDYKGKVFDTYIAERVLRAGFKEKRVSPNVGNVYFADVSCSLKAVTARRLEREISKEEQTSDWSAETLTQSQIDYSAGDVEILPEIAKQQIDELKEENLMGVYTIESKCIRPVALMAFTGMKVDLKKLQELKVDIQSRLEQQTNNFIQSLDSRLPEGSKLPRREDGQIAVGKNPKKEFNPGSNKQLIEAFTLCKIEVPKNQQTDKPTLNQIALAEFDSEDETLRLFRERTKTETELEHVEKLILNVNPVTLRIHAGYNQVGANSGRFTSSGAKKQGKKAKKNQFAVNIQQVPRSPKFRSCFTTDEGHSLVICDWAQIELRLGAQLINIPQMKEAFKNNIDLHSLTASLIYKKDINKVTKDERQDGKTLNFALLYGMGYRKYKTYAAQSGKIISLGEAKIAHNAFHMAYPRLKAWHQERAALVNDGWAYVRTACGRRRLLSYDDATMMCSANTLIQGSGADIMKIAISNLAEHLCEDVKLVACVHDELVLEVVDSKAEESRELLERIMIEAAEVVLTDIPAEADANVGKSWADK